MNKTTIETSIAIALRCNWTAVKLGHELSGPGYNLTPPEATIIMDEYRRRYPNAAVERQSLPRRERRKIAVDFETRSDQKGPVISILPATPKLPRRKAKATPTVAAEGGELLTTPTAGRPSIINRSAVKSFALKVSKEKRAGKFNRVSKEFLDSVEANLEALIREIAQGFARTDTVVPDPESAWMINGRTLRCAEDKLNEAVQKIVLAKVHGHPSIGKTLK